MMSTGPLASSPFRHGGTPLINGVVAEGATILHIDGAAANVQGYFLAGETLFVYGVHDSDGRAHRHQVRHDIHTNAYGCASVCLSNPVPHQIPDNAMVSMTEPVDEENSPLIRCPNCLGCVRRQARKVPGAGE